MNPYVAQLKAQLTPPQLMLFESEMRRYRREPILAFLLAFFLGLFGAHHFYLGRTQAGIIMLACTLSVVGLVVSFPWKIINWFTVWGECDEANDELEYALAYSMVYGQQPPGAAPRRSIGGLPMTT
ncbi:MAG TPA: NINE protein [Candidatus Baltobacteraceae bacterium]|jgi:TM2 domain-containing membrane protein YozV